MSVLIFKRYLEELCFIWNRYIAEWTNPKQAFIVSI